MFTLSASHTVILCPLPANQTRKEFLQQVHSIFTAFHLTDELYSRFQGYNNCTIIELLASTGKFIGTIGDHRSGTSIRIEKGVSIFFEQW